MKWHKGTDLPHIETETALCVVQYKYPVNEDAGEYELNYELMLFHKSTNSFSKQSDVKGITGLRSDLIVRWAYVEEDDDIAEEETALVAVSATISHLKSIIQILLTDCISTPKDYREKIGLDELFSFDKKISNRIVELDNHWK